MVTRTAREGPTDWKRHQPTNGIADKGLRRLRQISEGELGESAAEVAKLVEFSIGVNLRHCRQSEAVLGSLVEGRRNDFERADLILSRLRRIEDTLLMGRDLTLAENAVAAQDDAMPEAVDALRQGQASIVATLKQFEERLKSIERVAGEALEAAQETQTQTESLVEASTASPEPQSLADAVEHTRAVTQGIARKLDDLSQSVIERQLDPVVCEMAKVHGELSRIAEQASESVNGDLDAVNNQIARFLDSCDLLLIAPQPGDKPNPRTHEIIKQETSNNGHRSGAIARVFWPGLARGKRIVRRAQVSVYKSNEAPDQTEGDER